MNYEKEKQAIKDRHAAELAEFKANYNKSESEETNSELLKALKGLMYCDCHDIAPGTCCRHFQAAKDAIAKATGEKS